jgi:hypothetical protein
MVSQDTEFATHSSPDPTYRKKNCFALFVSLWFGQVLVLRLKAEAKSKEKHGVRDPMLGVDYNLTICPESSS